MATRFVLPLADVGSGIKPSDGAQLFFSEEGETFDAAPKDTFSNEAATLANANPLIADSTGVFPECWITGRYKVVLKDKNNVQTWEEDPVIELVNFSSASVSFETVDDMTSNLAIVAGQFISVEDYATGNGSGVLFFKVVAGAAPSADGGNQIGHDTLNVYFQQNFPGFVPIKAYGAKGNGVADDNVALEAAAAFVNQQRVSTAIATKLFFQSGRYISSLPLDWTLFEFIDIEGLGQGRGIDQPSVIEFTSNAGGLTFAGSSIRHMGFIGNGVGSTADGLKIVGNGRKLIFNVRTQSFNNGIVFSEGNGSSFDMIESRLNNNDGFLADITTGDSNTVNIGKMNLGSNGGIGFNMQTGTTPNVAQLWFGGQITCENNTGVAANISGRGHNLNISDEQNGAGIVFDANSEGNSIVIPFGGVFADNGANNHWISHRIGSVETVQNFNLQMHNSIMQDHALTGRFLTEQLADRILTHDVAGSGSAFSERWLNSVTPGSITLSCEGSIASDGNTSGEGFVYSSFTDAQLNDITDAINTTIKDTGKTVRNSTQLKLVTAAGSGPSQLWHNQAAGVANTPA